jgi:hypothetical protein
MRKSEIISAFLEECFGAKRSFPSGVACTYVQLTDEIGVKCYPDARINRNYSFRKQKFLHSKRLAPKPYFKFEVYDPFYEGGIPCYVTQHAEPCCTYDFRKLRNAVELKNKLLKLKIVVTDVKARNCGFINGRLVLIDCDYNSI